MGMDMNWNWLEQLRDQFVRQPQRLAPTEPPTAAPVEERRLGLALGGGGGKGTAHLGVLQVLEELEVPIDLIVGTSAGGAVAVMYAAGFSFAEIRETFRANALRRVFVTDPTRTGFIGQRKREEMLTRLLGDRTFADLRLPVAVVATDLVSGQAVVLNEGPLVPALLATTALPGIFSPVVQHDMVLADGGIVNNLPIDIAEALGASKVIAVELNDAVPGFTLASVEAENPLARLMLAPQQFAIATRAISLIVARTTELQLCKHPPALLLSPEVSTIHTLDFANPEKGSEVGAVAARAKADALQELRSWRLEEPVAEPAPAAPLEAPPEQAAQRPRWNLPFALPRLDERVFQSKDR